MRTRLWIAVVVALAWASAALAQQTNALNEPILKSRGRTYTGRQVFQIIGIPACAADPPVGACTSLDICVDDTNDALYACIATVWTSLGPDTSGFLRSDEADSADGVITFNAAPIIDVTDAEALLVRVNSDGGDIFTVDTSGGRATFGSSGNECLVNITDDGSTGDQALRIVKDFTDHTVAEVGILLTPSFIPASNTTQQKTAFNANLVLDAVFGSKTFGTVINNLQSMAHFGTGTVANWQGVTARPTLVFGPTITVTEAFLSDPGTNATGSWGTAYGYRHKGWTGATTASWAFYADADKSFFGDDINMDAAKKVQFRDSAIFINSAADGHLDLDADTSVDVNSDLVVSGAVTPGSLILPNGADPPATCTVGSVFLDTDETDDTNCTTTADNSLCLCTATDTWTALENN